MAPPPEVRLAIHDQTGAMAIPGKRVPADNWHITLRFLGEVDEITADRYIAAIDQSDLGRSFIVGLDHIGAFPKPSRAGVVWAGVGRGSQRLFQLAEIADERALDTGLAGEDRPFRPHLTLSMIRPQAPVAELVDESELDVSWRVDALTLFRTVPGRGSVSYEGIEVFPLAR